MVRAGTLLVALLTTLAGCARLVGGSPADLAAHVTITRDEWGVPHIEGESDAAALFGLAYAMAEDGYRQIEEEYIHALGRAAHWYGPDQLAADVLQAAFEVERLGREEYEREPRERKVLWSAFTDGLNHYLHTSGERPRLITAWEPWMLFARARAVPAGTRIDGLLLGSGTASDGTYDLAGAWETSAAAGPGAPQSAAWAVAPARTAAGHALLLHGTDAPFTGTGRPYEAQVTSRSGWRVRGFMPLGSPVVRSGHTDGLAWGHTESDADAADVWEVVFDHPTDRLLYRHGGEWRRAEEWQDTLLVNTEDGVRPRVVTFRRTHHGPVVAEREGRALAVGVARMREGGSLQQWLAMSRARSLEEFRAALDQRSLPLNTLYADTAGNLYYLHGNAVPVRDTAADWTRPVDGSDPRSDWRGYHSIGDLPEVLNPASGRIVSFGHGPFRAVAPAGTEAAFPAYVTGGGATAAAALTVRRMLDADSAWTLEGWSRTAFDATVADGGDEIGRLSLEWEEVGGRNPIRARALDAVIDSLREWDRVAGTESAAATLFVLWQERLRGGAVTGDLARFRAMEDVVAVLERQWRTPFVAWGEVQRLRPNGTAGSDDGTPGHPLPGAPAATGAILKIEAEPEAGSGRRTGVSGRAWIGAVELSPEPRSRWVAPFGQSARPETAHGFDQAALFARGELRPARATDDGSRPGRPYRPPPLR